MCLFIQNQNFERYTENMLNRLAEGAGYAREQLAEAARNSAALSKETAELAKKAEVALGMLRQHGELEEVRALLAGGLATLWACVVSAAEKHGRSAVGAVWATWLVLSYSAQQGAANRCNACVLLCTLPIFLPLCSAGVPEAAEESAG